MLGFFGPGLLMPLKHADSLMCLGFRGCRVGSCYCLGPSAGCTQCRACVLPASADASKEVRDVPMLTGNQQ